jgi:hypothetical protein
MASTWTIGPYSQAAGQTLIWTFTFPQYPGAQVIVPILTGFNSELQWGPTQETYSDPDNGGSQYQTYVMTISVLNSVAATFDIAGLNILSA